MSNKYDTQLCELIHIERSIIPADLCDYLVESIETDKWSPHKWHNGITNTSKSEETKELDVQNITDERQQLLSPFLSKACVAYNTLFSFNCEKTKRIVSKFSPIRFNRYSPGQIMRQHHDHIRSLFDGDQRGIPVLSLILNLNDDYEGAELFFWDDYVVPLGKGDIIIFPSLFLFPHGVKEATKGKRYSAVSWAW